MNVGIITYHAAYNFGSVLQAYATLMTVKKLGLSAKIVNYRPEEQKKFYQHLVRMNYGIRTFVKDFQMLLNQKDRKLRMERFEQFFMDYYDLTEEITCPEDVSKCFSQFDILISGSDQVLNKHSCELEHVGWKYMMPYLLEDFSGKKVSYASSTANMTVQDMEHILPELKQFQHISARESSSARQLSTMLGKEVMHVSDPTFLFTAQEWKDALHIPKGGKGNIVYYSLKGINTQKKRLKDLEMLAAQEDCKVEVVTPFSAPASLKKCFEYHYEYGPREFINSINNANMIVTDSYHGTILSVNLGKSVYSICSGAGSEFRKTDVLNHVGLESRIIENIADIDPSAIQPGDPCIQNRVSDFREKSLDYLRNALDVK